MVASKLAGGSYAVDTTQIPATCNPGTAPYTVGRELQVDRAQDHLQPGPVRDPVRGADARTTRTPKIACNTIRVYQGRDVPFAFAPAGGIAKGGTGNLISVACKGSCGTIAPNPMDVAVVADRTGSMSTTDVGDMVAGIQGMLKEMTPSQQYVALGTIGRAGDRAPPASRPSCTPGPARYPARPDSRHLDPAVLLEQLRQRLGTSCRPQRAGQGPSSA